ncbi:HD domain-containing phosphohydrolase [Halopseudomonas oceani]|uniref:HD domain-containing phosphohydrolase n=1 Tax=Halopseudomonas oceani TaxID=1708783 RepID=UPI002AA7D5CC|nr:HD domain-containing phosphohydrolase [Halopseudomonas oceani]
MPFKDTRQVLLLVDDEPANLHVLKHILQEHYRLLFARDGQRALELAAAERPQLILLDVMMPGMTGHEVCAQLKSDPHTSDIPVIFVTALSNVDDEIRGFELGAVDYITKPVSAPIVKARVRTHLSLVRAEVLRETRLNIVQALGMAAEYKDNETGLHVIRMSHFSRIIALEAGFNAEEADELLHAAPMHDVGKIGIPDAILQKPGKLDDAEWEIMQKHPEIGAQIIGEHDASMLKMAHRIALGHHEKWDGSGYPAGLAGNAIPIEARIVAIADVFDALTSVRPYKKAWSVEDAVALIREQSGRHFDPDLVDCFLRRLDDINHIRERWAE